MTQVIIYKSDDGGVVEVCPAPECGLTVEQIALKDVPFGKPFKIVDAADIPVDRTQRNAWTVDEADLTDGVGADYGVGSENPFVMPEAAE
jgi:hypothetical protein